MRHRVVLPEELGEQFALRDALSAGVGKWRASTADLHRPFRGVRSKTIPDTFHAAVACYLPRLRPRHRLVGRSAMRLWGIPHPRWWSPDEALEVAVPRDLTPPKAAGVKGRRLDADRAGTWTVRGIRVVDPVAALFTTARELRVADAVVAIDAIITTASNYRGLVPGRPVPTRDQIRKRLAEWGAFPGCGSIRAAVELARERVESPKETQTRLLLVHHGLPEPTVQHEVFADGRFVARIDLAYPQLKIAIEYEGDGHRTDKHQWRIDIRRQRDLEARGWIVIRLTEADLVDPEALIQRIRRAITSRR